jgi:hypothetical protein
VAFDRVGADFGDLDLVVRGGAALLLRLREIQLLVHLLRRHQHPADLAIAAEDHDALHALHVGLGTLAITGGIHLALERARLGLDDPVGGVFDARRGQAGGVQFAGAAGQAQQCDQARETRCIHHGSPKVD